VAYGAVLDLSDTSLACCLIAVSMMTKRYRWHNDNVPLTDTEWDNVDTLVSLTLDELMSNLVGLCVPAIFATASAFKFLPLDGGIYEKNDYPLLYDALDSQYVISGSQFTVPDFRNRVPVGAGGNYALGDTFGVDAVTLTIDEIPAHTHTETYPSFNVDLEAPGAPDVLAAGNPPITQPTGSAGGGLSHENRQPSIAVNWFVIAG